MCSRLAQARRNAHAACLPQEEAYEKNQKYKEGKYILERCKIAEDAGSDSDCQYEESEEDEL